MIPSDSLSRHSVGNASLTIPRVCFGTSGIGNMPDTYGYSVDEERARDTLRAVLDLPGSMLDTSRNYGDGRSEARIGEVIRERGLPDGCVLSTKLDRDMATGRFDAAQARRSLEESLSVLGVDKVQLLHLHDPEHAASLDGIVGAEGALAELFRMRDEGLADAVGLAAGRVDIMMPLMQEWDFDAIITHNRYTLLNRNADAMIDMATSRHMAVINAAPYASGVLAKGSEAHPRVTYQLASDDMLTPVRTLESVCSNHGVPLGAVALQFSTRDPRIASTLCGVTRPERVAETLQWAALELPEELWTELAALPIDRSDPEASRVYSPG